MIETSKMPGLMAHSQNGKYWPAFLAGALFLLFPTWIAASHGVLLLITIYVVADFDRQRFASIVERAPVLWTLGAIYLMVIVGTTYSPAPWKDILLHWQKYLRFLYPFVLLLLLADRQRLQEIALNAFMTAMGFIAVSSWLNIWFVLPWSASKKPGWGENHFVIGDHITQNVMMALFVVIALQRALQAPDRNRRLFWALATLSGTVSITHLSFGRTGLVVLLAGLLGWMFGKFSGKKLVMVLALLVAVGGIAIWTSSAMTQRIQKGIAEAEHSEDNRVTSIGHRLYNYKITLQMMAAAPIIGHGTASFHTEFCKFMEDPTDCLRYAWHPHNQFLMMGAEHGIAGLGLYILMILMLVQAGRRSPDNNSAALMYGLVGILIADSLVNSPFFSSRESQFFAYAMALLLSMNLSGSNNEADRPADTTSGDATLASPHQG